MKNNSFPLRFGTDFGDAGLRAATLDDLLQYIIEQPVMESTLHEIDTILLSFHLYTTVHSFLTTIDVKFWRLCLDSDAFPNEKANLIRSLTKILDRWLDSPYLESFYSPPDFIDLKKLLYVVSQWLRVFVPNFQPIRLKPSKSKPLCQDKLVMRARDYIQPLAPPCRSDIVQIMEEICIKINNASDRFHLLAGLFKEANCDKNIVEAGAESELLMSIGSDFMNQLSPRHIAEQFTLYDADLFLKVLPSECLDYVRHRSAPTVDSTIQQYNRIFGLVLTTIIEAGHFQSNSITGVSTPPLASLALSVVTMPLANERYKDPNDNSRHSARLLSSRSGTSCQSSDSTPASDTLFRAEALTKWITIAAELRTLRSFSAFTAVMTALQGYAISSLHETWSYVERHYPEKKEVFCNLSQLLNLEDNKKYARELLDHMYSSYELERHQDSRHNILSTIFRRKNDFDCFSQEESVMKTVGTIPYLGIFLNDLAMLHESAPDRVPLHKTLETQRPASSSNIDKMARDRRKHHNGLPAQRNHQCRSVEPSLTPPLLSAGPPRRPPWRAGLTDSPDSGTGSACGDPSSRRPPVPAVTDRRSRQKTANSATDSSTTPTSSEVVIPRDNRGRAPRPCPRQRHNAGATSACSRLGERSLVGSVASSTTDAAALVTSRPKGDYLINFRKHRREYKVLEKLMSLQSSATRYKIHKDEAFKQWFESFVLISESVANERAKELEPPRRKWKGGMGDISGSLDVLFTVEGSGLDDDACQREDFSRTHLSPPLLLPSHSLRLNKLSNCHSAIGLQGWRKRVHDERGSEKRCIRKSLKGTTHRLRNHSGSADDLIMLTRHSSRPLAHFQLSSIKKKIGDALHHSRASSSKSAFDPVVHLQRCTPF